jgi:ribonucleoside-diphosphate reductase subunit M1
MYTHRNPKNNDPAPLIADDVYDIIMQVCQAAIAWFTHALHRLTPTFMHMQNAARLDSEIIYDRDFDYDYFGFKV